MTIRNPQRLAIATAIAAAALLPLAAQAHRAWLLPSATVLSGSDVWVTVDAAVSNDLFYFEHQPMRLDGLKVFAPDGNTVEAQNASTGRYRSTFDVKLDKPGTWRVSSINDSITASYKEGSEVKRIRAASFEELRKQIPAGATDVSVGRNQTRLDAFVTNGKPTEAVLKPVGTGLELVAYTHPNDLIAGEPASFGLVFDGKPVADVPVSLIPGGIRYRDQLGEIKVVTGKDGRFSVTWPEPGMYWLNASYPPRGEEDESPPQGGAGGSGGGGPGAGGPPGGRGFLDGGTLDKPARRSAYTATLEVLAP